MYVKYQLIELSCKRLAVFITILLKGVYCLHKLSIMHRRDLHLVCPLFCYCDLASPNVNQRFELLYSAGRLRDFTYRRTLGIATPVWCLCPCRATRVIYTNDHTIWIDGVRRSNAGFEAGRCKLCDAASLLARIFADLSI